MFYLINKIAALFETVTGCYWESRGMNKNNATCLLCKNEYSMGYSGTVDGCDICLKIIRDKDGYFYEPDELFIQLVNIDTGETEVHPRPVTEE